MAVFVKTRILNAFRTCSISCSNSVWNNISIYFSKSLQNYIKRTNKHFIIIQNERLRYLSKNTRKLVGKSFDVIHLGCFSQPAFESWNNEFVFHHGQNLPQFKSRKQRRWRNCKHSCQLSANWFLFTNNNWFLLFLKQDHLYNSGKRSGFLHTIWKII